jgi:hypothetical protein
LNTYIPLRTDKERYYENYEVERQKRNGYNNQHKEELNANRREKMKEPEEKAKKAQKDKAYREANKEKVATKSRQWRENNADKLKEQRSTLEYKQNRNERRRNTVHHCEICDVDIKGDISAFDRHCKTICHIEKSNVIV